MSRRDIGTEILEGIHVIKQFKNERFELRTSELSEPSSPGIIRLKLNLSQSAFAGLMGVSVRTLQDWEQGRRDPHAAPHLQRIRL
jgi:putative transcriptional regulator